MRTGCSALVVFAGVGLGVTCIPPGVAARPAACDAISVPPGAVHLSSDQPTNAVFSGNLFAIDGNDGALTGGAGPMPAVYGVATRTEANAQEVRDSLATAQLDNITGRGYSPGPPIQPSIAATAGPSAEEISQLVADLLLLPGTVTSGATTFSGNLTFGTQSSPQITHWTGEGSGVRVSGNGNVSGAGVLIVEDTLTVEGSFQFAGLVLVRGQTNLAGTTELAANAVIFGSLWTTSLTIGVGGAFYARYSSDGLALAQSLAQPACPVCGDGTVGAGEDCDDGNVADGDCCSSACTLDPAGAPCDDGDACTEGKSCVQGACIGSVVDCGACAACDHALGCVAAPAEGCLQPIVPSRSRLILRTEPAQVAWTWRPGDAALADFGDPLAADGYTLCIFADEAQSTVLLGATAPAGGVCDGRPCWTPSGEKGFRYRDALARGGLATLRLTAGAEGKAKLKAVGKGPSLDSPLLPAALPLRVQLRAGAGACWETEYPAASVRQDPRRLIGHGGSPGD